MFFPIEGIRSLRLSISRAGMACPFISETEPNAPFCFSPSVWERGAALLSSLAGSLLSEDRCPGLGVARRVSAVFGRKPPSWEWSCSVTLTDCDHSAGFETNQADSARGIFRDASPPPALISPRKVKRCSCVEVLVDSIRHPSAQTFGLHQFA